MKRASAALIALVLGAACTEKSEQAKPPTVSTIPLGPPPPPPPTTPVAPSTGYGGDLTGVEILADNTVVFASQKWLVAIDANGAVKRVPLPAGTSAKLAESEHGDAIVLESGDQLTLLKSPTLEPLWTGKGQALQSVHGAIGSQSSALFVVAGAVVRLDLPADPPRKIEGVELSPTRKFAVVTYSIDGQEAPAALAFDLTTKKSTGRAEAMPPFSYPARAMLVGDRQLALVNGNVVEINLATGKTRKQKVCGNPSFGNPMLSPSGDSLLVTCGADGLLLDAKTFAVKRRFTKILPGCDNGDSLPGSFDPKVPGDLIVLGCGGHARLDTTTGKYRCSDGKELVGAPYPGMSPGENLAPGIPADRIHLPLCTKSTSAAGTYHLGMSFNWYLESSEDAPAVAGPLGRVPIEPGTGAPLISADESRIAYETGDRVIVRGLPAGTIVAQVPR